MFVELARNADEKNILKIFKAGWSPAGENRSKRNRYCNGRVLIGCETPEVSYRSNRHPGVIGAETAAVIDNREYSNRVYSNRETVDVTAVLWLVNCLFAHPGVCVLLLELKPGGFFK